MSTDAFALVLGTLLAIGALAYVLQPLFVESRATDAPPPPQRAGDDTAIAALREIEFDRATGKLSDSDYAELRRTYAERAVREMRSPRGEGLLDGPDFIEARIRAYRQSHRECPSCGLRPEADAAYCSTCGAFLDQRCADCGNMIEQPGSQFCSTCGGRLGRRVPIAR
jgi:Double zinc ribbon